MARIPNLFLNIHVKYLSYLKHMGFSEHGAACYVIKLRFELYIFLNKEVGCVVLFELQLHQLSVKYAWKETINFRRKDTCIVS